MKLKVTCSCSGKEFDPLFATPGAAPTQAYGCACEVSGGRLVGHFGSAYDMTVFAFTVEPPPEGAIVCDECVAEMLADERLKEI